MATMFYFFADRINLNMLCLNHSNQRPPDPVTHAHIITLVVTTKKKIEKDAKISNDQCPNILYANPKL